MPLLLQIRNCRFQPVSLSPGLSRSLSVCSQLEANKQCSNPPGRQSQVNAPLLSSSVRPIQQKISKQKSRVESSRLTCPTWALVSPLTTWGIPNIRFQSQVLCIQLYSFATHTLQMTIKILPTESKHGPQFAYNYGQHCNFILLFFDLSTLDYSHHFFKSQLCQMRSILTFSLIFPSLVTSPFLLCYFSTVKVNSSHSIFVYALSQADSKVY